MKVIKFFLALVVVVLVLVVLAVLSVPKFISSERGRELVLTKVNEKVPGTLQIDDWNIGWFDGISIEGIAFDDAEGRPVARVDEVSISKSLVQLARNYQHVGDILVRNPQLTVYQPTEAVPEETKPEETTEASPRPDRPKPAESAEWAIPDIHLHVLVDGGAVRTGTSESDAVLVAKDIELDLNLDGFSKPLQYSLSLTAGSGEGSIQCKGQLDLGDVANLDPNRIRTETSLKIDQWQLAETLGLLSAIEGVPSGSGQVAVDVDVRGSLADGINVTSLVTGQELAFAGGPFKDDHPSIPALLFQMQARFADNSLSISNATFESSLAQANASGTVGTDADGQVTLTGSVDLAEVARQFRTTLGLKDSLLIDEANVRIKADVGSQAGTYRTDSEVAIDRISGSSDGVPLNWDEPTTLHAIGAWGAEQKKLDKLQFVSPFMTVNGSGDLNALEIAFEADTGAALVQAKKFIDLQEWDIQGAVDGLIELKTTFAEADGGAIGKPVSAAVNLTVAGDTFSVRKGDQQLVPARPLQVQAGGEIHFDENQAPREIVAPKLTFSTWLGAGKVDVARVVLPADGGIPKLQGLVGSGDLDLDLVNSLLREMKALPEDLSLGGKANWNAKVGLEAGIVQVSAVGLALTGLRVQQGEKAIPAQNLSIQTSGQANLEARSAQFDSVTVGLDSGPLEITGIRVADWAKPLDSMTASIDTAQDLAALMTVLGDFAALPDGRSLAGLFEGNVLLSSDAERGQGVELKGNLSGLRVSEGEKSLLDEEEAIAVVAKLNRQGTNLEIREFSLESNPIKLDLAGQFQTEGELSQAQAKGDLAIDLDVVTTYLTSLLAMDVSMTGNHKRPFEFASSWRADEKQGLLKNANLDLGFHADTIQAFGVNVVDLDVPLSMTSGVAHLDVTGVVNEGQLTLHPTLDFGQGDGLVTFPEDTNIFTSVQLTEEIANELLAKFHPLFKGATGVTGSMDLHMAAFNWPLGADQGPNRTFNGTLGFVNLKLGTSGMWFRLMELMKVNEREIEIGDRDMDFECRDERVYCSPLRIDVDHHEVSIEGSIGFDQTLDYVAKVPVTESLARSMGVGATDYTNYLAGTTINVPIRGTASNPDISSKVLTDAVSDLAKQAAKKAVSDKVKGAIGEEAGKVLEGLFGR